MYVRTPVHASFVVGPCSSADVQYDRARFDTVLSFVDVPFPSIKALTPQLSTFLGATIVLSGSLPERNATKVLVNGVHVNGPSAVRLVLLSSANDTLHEVTIPDFQQPI